MSRRCRTRPRPLLGTESASWCFANRSEYYGGTISRESPSGKRFLPSFPLTPNFSWVTVVRKFFLTVSTVFGCLVHHIDVAYNPLRIHNPQTTSEFLSYSAPLRAECRLLRENSFTYY